MQPNQKEGRAFVSLLAVSGFTHVAETVVNGTTGITMETLPNKRKRTALSEEAKTAKIESDRNHRTQE